MGDVRDINKKLGDVNSKLGGFGKSASKLGGMLRTAFAGVAIGAVFKDIVSGASDAQQSLGGTEAVFGKFANTVKKRSNEAANAYGLSANSYRESANLIGAQLKNQGLAMDQLAGKTDKLIGLGSDLAATYGGTTKDAVDALSSAFKGEFDPIEKYGITLKQSTVNLEAFRLAGVKTQSEFNALSLTQQTAAKRQATLNLLYKQAGPALGQFQKQTNTLAEQQQILGAKFQNVKDSLGMLLLPMLTKLASYVADKVVPKLQDFVDWLKANQDQIKATASSVGDTLLPILKGLADVLATVARFFAGLPAPVKQFGVEIALAALIVPRLTGALNVAKATVTDFGKRVNDTKTRTAALGGALRNVAGVGGVAALTDSLRKNTSTLSANAGALNMLEEAGGGAAAGFAVGGPWGAAIGGAAGLLHGLYRNTIGAADATNAIKDAQRKAIPVIGQYTDTLNQQSGAYTNLTRKTVAANLAKQGFFDDARKLGVNPRDVVSAALGDPAALERVRQGWLKNQNILNGLQRGPFLNWIKGTRAELDKEGKSIRDTNDAAQTWKQTLKGIPKNVRTVLKQEGYQTNIGQLRDLVKKYHLTPKQVKTIIKAENLPFTVKQVLGLQGDLKKTGRQKPDFAPWMNGLHSNVNKGKQTAKGGTNDINKSLHDAGKDKGSFGTFWKSLASNMDKSKASTKNTKETINKTLAEAGKTKPNFAGFNSAIRAEQGAAHSGGVGVGSSLGAGISVGFAPTAARLAAQASAAVNAGIAAARRAADAHSPSRKTKKLGKDMAQGLINGWREYSKKLAVMTASDVKRLIAKTGSTIKHYHKQLTPQMRNLEKRLLANAKAYDKVAGTVKNLAAKYKDLKAQIIDQAKTYTDITQSGAAFNANAMIASMQTKLAKVQQFNALIAQLVAQGLNKSTVNQLLQAGVEGGLAYAQALSNGGKSAISSVNALQTQIDKATGALGKTGADAMYKSGLNAAKGLLDGLSKNQRRLVNVGKKLANTLVAALKRQLGIHSPSTAFAALGLQTVKGLEVGLKDTSGVKRSMVRLGDAMTNAFDPKLQTYAKTNGAGTTVQFTVNVPPTANKADIGREISSALDAYYKQGGRRLAV